MLFARAIAQTEDVALPVLEIVIKGFLYRQFFVRGEWHGVGLVLGLAPNFVADLDRIGVAAARLHDLSDDLIFSVFAQGKLTKRVRYKRGVIWCRYSVWKALMMLRLVSSDAAECIKTTNCGCQLPSAFCGHFFAAARRLKSVHRAIIRSANSISSAGVNFS